MNKSKINRFFKKIYDDEIEHVGFILANGDIVEVLNTLEDKSGGFDVGAADIKKYADAIASWHTHPQATSNLSSQDYENFLVWSNMEHYIIGTDGVTKYVVRDGDVLVD